VVGTEEGGREGGFAGELLLFEGGVGVGGVGGGGGGDGRGACCAVGRVEHLLYLFSIIIVLRISTKLNMDGVCDSTDPLGIESMGFSA